MKRQEYYDLRELVYIQYQIDKFSQYVKEMLDAYPFEKMTLDDIKEYLKERAFEVEQDVRHRLNVE